MESPVWTGGMSVWSPTVRGGHSIDPLHCTEDERPLWSPLCRQGDCMEPNFTGIHLPSIWNPCVNPNMSSPTVREPPGNFKRL